MDAQIELVEPAAPDSPVVNFLKKGGGCTTYVMK
jgi:hypothetical protein